MNIYEINNRVYTNNTYSADLNEALSQKGIEPDTYYKKAVLKKSDGNPADLVRDAEYIEFEAINNIANDVDIVVAAYYGDRLTGVGVYNVGEKYLIPENAQADRILIMILESKDNLKPLAYKVEIKE